MTKWIRLHDEVKRYGLNEKSIQNHYKTLKTEGIIAKPAGRKHYIVDVERFAEWMTNWLSTSDVAERTGIPVEFIRKHPRCTPINGEKHILRRYVDGIIEKYGNALGGTVSAKKARKLLGYETRVNLYDRDDIRKVNIRWMVKGCKPEFRYSVSDIKAIVNMQTSFEPESVVEPESRVEPEFTAHGANVYHLPDGTLLIEQHKGGQWWKMYKITKEDAFNIFKFSLSEEEPK